MSQITIRPMASEDITTVVDMIGALSTFHHDTAAVTAETLTRDTDPADPWMYAYVAEVPGDIIGYMILIRLAKVADGLRGIDINHLYVAQDWRRRGVGRQLIDAAKVKAQALGCSYMFIGTAPDNHAAQKTYVACGFNAFPASTGSRFRMLLPHP